MESNAFSKSKNIPTNVNLILTSCNISFISWEKAFSVEELFLKPYCSVANILFWLMCWYNLLNTVEYQYNEILETSEISLL